ncbi:hypothetical protein F4703DRAFT_1792923 [Phycomyces blakesleeanus]
MSTPTRSLNLNRHSDDPLEGIRKKTCTSLHKSLQTSHEMQSVTMTTEQLAIAFIQLNEFSTASRGSFTYCKTDMCLEEATKIFLCRLCQNNYVASLIAIEWKLTYRPTWNQDTTLDKILESSLKAFVVTSEPMRDGVYLEHFLQLLQDPNKLKIFSRQERQILVTTLLDRVLWQTDAIDCSVQSIMSAKELVCADGSKYFTTRRSILGYLTSWLKDEKQPSPAFYCPLLPCCALDKNLSNSTIILSLCRAMCESLEGDQAIVRIVESVSAYTSLIFEELSNQADLGRLALLLSFIQITLHYKGDSVGLNYASWFQSALIDPNTTCLKTKKNGQVLIKCLEDMIPFESPAILQIHARALYGCQALPSSHYISIVKTRLLDLGLDSSLKQLPLSINTPLVTEKGKVVRGHSALDIQELVQTYVNTNTVPKSLWEASIFQARWFKATFLPALVSWNHTDQQLSVAHKKLIKSLYEKGKMPDGLYREFQNMV